MSVLEDECIICFFPLFEPFLDDPIAIMECNHYFHYRCIKKWLKTRQVCPICGVGKVLIPRPSPFKDNKISCCNKCVIL